MFQESWGGLIETLESCEENNEVTEKIKILKEKLKVLESSKNLKEIQHALHFTIEERNYLNSPLLDEIFNTIFSENPLEKALEDRKKDIATFYIKRGLKISEIFFRNFVYGDVYTSYDSAVEYSTWKLKFLQSVNINTDTKEFRKISNFWRP